MVSSRFKRVSSTLYLPPIPPWLTVLPTTKVSLVCAVTLQRCYTFSLSITMQELVRSMGGLNSWRKRRTCSAPFFTVTVTKTVTSPHTST